MPTPVYYAMTPEEQKKHGEMKRAQVQERFKNGLCCTSSYETEQFTCNEKVPPETLAQGCGICPKCQKAADDYEGGCDSVASSREDHQRDE